MYGLDISMKCTGIAIYDLNDRKFVLVDSFNTEKIYATKENKGKNLHALKLIALTNWMKEITTKYPPALVSIERMFSRFNNETQTIAKATGVIQTVLWSRPMTFYPPKSVKSTIVHGSATKEDVANAILTSATYNYITVNNEDESDAVAVAMTYLIDKELIEWDKPLWADIKKIRKQE